MNISLQCGRAGTGAAALGRGGGTHSPPGHLKARRRRGPRHTKEISPTGDVTLVSRGS